jgi:hypothetical protein
MDQENTNTTTVAPNPAQAGGQPAVQAATENGNAGTTPAFKPEDLLRATGFQRSPEEEREIEKKRYEASTREATRLKGLWESVSKAAAEQGVELLADKEGKFQGFKPTDKYSPELPALKFNFDDLSDKEKAMFADEPEKAFESVVNKLLNRAQKAYTRIQPTVTEVLEPLTEDKFKSVVEFLATRKDPVTGDTLYPEIGKDADLLRAIAAQELPEGLVTALKKHPDVMIELLYGRMDAARSRLSAWAERTANQKKAQEAQRVTESQLQPQARGTVTVAEGEDAKKQFLASLKGTAPVA